VVCFAGIIGFVGLVAGQMARLMFGWANRRVIPFSALIGGLLLAFSDLLGRTPFKSHGYPRGDNDQHNRGPCFDLSPFGGEACSGCRGLRLGITGLRPLTG